ncbi:ChaN family lipoprotein [Candidatus Sulfurimonas marisnigri]|uniref:ChaN family lipoprotein n=1 Tax=Candidatus Sulfurimonas marisnigri TaxID=2740405 RepID=A0A7S7RRI6_9BACT|nr:ChaN family lipoprotein [Candidatus Sulfurimonas marisnigri]QOY55811.1 ChaN family lipoprotein [Candidatus Sulfurimonas marisnigri]
MQLILTLFLSIVFFGCTEPSTPKQLYHSLNCKESIYSLKSAECINHEEFIETLESYKVIFIGDHHSSKKHHENVADIIYSLSKKGYRIHLANEWFTPEDNNILDKYANGSLNDEEFTKKINWKTRKYFQFDLFSPIYHAVIDTKGKLYGINLSKKQRKLISTVNTTGMNRNEKIFFNTLDVDVLVHKTFLSPFFSHCHKAKNGESNQECINRMYSVQVAWDTKMAKESAKLANDVLRTNRDKLIVFAGEMHLINNIGVNLRFARESKIPFVTLLPQRKEYSNILHGKADFVYIYKQYEEASKIEAKLIQGI